MFSGLRHGGKRRSRLAAGPAILRIATIENKSYGYFLSIRDGVVFR